ncbi:MAG: serine/threonine protein kinase [Labilithrix sp.]|nr:serine/threonine protein kinase [Labilithrix sp.]
MTAADTIKDLHVQVKRCPECGTGFGREAAFCPFDGIALQTSTWDPTRDPLTDTVIDQRYEVEEPLGEGGMGTVYKVRHITLDRSFAMKVLRRDLAADAGLAARFLQEAKATAAIRHPSVVAINDFGELDDGAPYFVMDLLVGETLATRMRARGLLPPREAARIAGKLADALSAAHAANVVHRDLKPENVFLVGAAAGKSASDEIRIVDFGAAKIMGGSKLTRPGVVFGTPYYMSPEQASGQAVDARADIYSLGVLLYEMITGSLPFEADTYMGVLTKHMFAAPAKPSERAPAGAQLGELEAVVLRALEKEPSARYPSMKELGAALERAVSGRTSEAPRGDDRPAATVPFMGMSTADRIQRSVTRQLLADQRRKRRTIVVAAVSAAATLALCGLAVSLVDSPGSSASSSPPAVASPSATAPVPVPVPVPDPAALAPVASATLPAATTSASPPSVPSPPSPPPPSPPPARPRPSPPPESAGSPRPSPRPSAAPPPPPRTKSPDDLTDPWSR